MRLRCESIGQTFLPLFRSLLAARLVQKYGFSQVEVANRLGITQAAVSQYLHAKRAKRTLHRKPLMHEVEKMANTAASQISRRRMSPEDVTRMTCRLCAEMRTKLDM